MGVVCHWESLAAIVCLVCWTGVSLTAAATTGQALWTDYRRDSTKMGSSITVLSTEIPLTYYECVSTSVSIHKNGFLLLCGPDGMILEPPAPALWPSLPKLLGVYWSKLIPYGMFDKDIYYYAGDYDRTWNVQQESALIKYIKDVVAEPDFEPLRVVSATWENIRPILPVAGEAINESATFQVLLATDSRVTYAIRGYQSVWQSPELSNLTYYAATYSQGYGDRPKIVRPGSHAGPEVIRLGTKKPNKDAFTCVEKLRMVQDQLNSSLSALPPCPCYQVQAAADQQFQTSAADPHCYQRQTPPPEGSLLQLCCYNPYGDLINFTREAKVPVLADPTDRRLQDAYEKCCADESNLCNWFYYQTYKTKCTDYTPGFNKSQLPMFYNRDEDIVEMSLKTVFDLGLSVKSSSPVNYSLLTSFNESHGLSLSRNVMNWNVPSGLNELRKLFYPQRLVIYATDASNMSGSYAPAFKLCLCQQAQQCQFQYNSVRKTITQYGFNTFYGDDSLTIGNVISVMCDCNRTATGRFCERPYSVCDNCLVQNMSSGCDSNPQDYCPPCPLGYQRSGTQCLAIAPVTAPTTSTKSPGGGAIRTSSASFLIILSCITTYTLWIQNLLATRV